MTTKIEKFKKQIASLLAKAAGTDNQHEALAFTAKAQELMEKYQIDHGDVVARDEISTTTIWHGPKTFKKWHLDVPATIATYYGCKPIRILDSRFTRMIGVGRESARVTTEVMVPFLIGELREAAQKMSTETNFSLGRCMQLICDSFVIRLYTLINAAEKAAREAAGEHAKQDGNSRALVQVNEADAWYAEHHGSLIPGKPVTFEHNDRARELADAISLNKQVNADPNGETAVLEETLLLEKA